MFLRPPSEAFTVTFGDRAENEPRMEKIGRIASAGFSTRDLDACVQRLRERGIASTLVDLRPLHETPDRVPEAAVLVIPNAGGQLLGEGGVARVLRELKTMPKDKTTLMRGRVVTKRARHNNCMADYSQSPDIANGKGTVVDFKDFPALGRLREELALLLQPPAPLVGELNHYFDPAVCGIGWHGDAERRLVVGVRLGGASRDMPLRFRWHRAATPVGKEGCLVLDEGDVYVMSEKAVGTDWRSNSVDTLRHSTSQQKRRLDDALGNAHKSRRA